MPPLGELAASLHGRALEQDRLLGLLNDARSGRSGAAVLVGEPGAGKSALLELVRAAAEGMTVLEARGVESEATLPFAALHQLLRPVFELLERLPAPQASALRAAFALKGGGAPDLYRVPLAVLTLLAEAAEDQPLVCVIDDAQWVDGDSAQALTFAARRLQAERIAIVFAARKGEFDAAALPELRLEPLDTTAVEAILTARAGTAVAPDVARRIASATGGNALAVVELAPLLTREQLAGGEPLPQPVPMSAGVERLFADRVRGLPAEARLPLLVAAADDTGKPDAVAAAARRLGTDLAALDSAEEDGLIRVGAAEITFRHPLVRSAIYGTATFAERRAVHRALAQTFKDAGEIDRYAWHLAAATLEPEEEVARELEQAAARARSRNAFTAASAAAERAAELSPSPHEKGRRLAEAASDAWLTGLLPQAARLIEAAEPLVDDPVLLANCHRLRGSIELAAGTSTTAINMLVTGARRLRGVDPRRSLELLALAAEGASLSLDADASRAIADLASSLDVGEDEHDRFFIGLLVGFAQHLAGDTQSGIAAIREALAIAEDEFDDVDLMLAAGRAGFYVGDDAAALRFHTRIVSPGAIDRLDRMSGNRRHPARASGDAHGTLVRGACDRRGDASLGRGHRPARARGTRSGVARVDRRLAGRRGTQPRAPRSRPLDHSNATAEPRRRRIALGACDNRARSRPSSSSCTGAARADLASGRRQALIARPSRGGNRRRPARPRPSLARRFFHVHAGSRRRMGTSTPRALSGRDRCRSRRAGGALRRSAV